MKNFPNTLKSNVLNNIQKIKIKLNIKFIFLITKKICTYPVFLVDLY